MKTKRKQKLFWFARGKGIGCMGPFKSEVKAWEALKDYDGFPIEGALVWVSRTDIMAERRS